MDSAKTVTQSSLQFLSGTLISRFTGMLRDMLTAFCFGTDPSIAAFLVAFRLASLLRRVFGEGALTVGFIPHFETIQKDSSQRAAGFFCHLTFAMSAILIGLIAISELGLLSLRNTFSSSNQQVVTLTAIMLPGLLFICLFALFSALLQCHRQYFLPSFAPVAFNLVWIATAWIFRNQLPEDAVKGLAVAVTLAFLLQWAVLIPQAASILRPIFKFDFVHFLTPDLKALGASLSLGVIGVGAMQINSALDALFARFASLEGPAYLNYAIRIQQLPLALFAIAIASAVLPALSRAMAGDDRGRYLELLQFALSRTFSLIFPCTAAIFLVGGAAINLVFGRGQFGSESIIHTTTSLLGYGLGLVPAAFVILLASAFYARKDYRTPMLASLLAIAINVFLNIWLIFSLGYGPASVAVATSVAAWFNLGFLSNQLSKFTGTVFSPELIQSFRRVFLCTFVASAATLVICHYGLGDPVLQLLLDPSSVQFPHLFSLQVIHFFLPSCLFCFVLWLTAWVTKTRELTQLVDLFKRSS